MSPDTNWIQSSKVLTFALITPDYFRMHFTLEREFLKKCLFLQRFCKILSFFISYLNKNNVRIKKKKTNFFYILLVYSGGIALTGIHQIKVMSAFKMFHILEQVTFTHTTHFPFD